MLLIKYNGGFFSISGQTGRWKPIPTTKEEPCWSGEYTPIRRERNTLTPTMRTMT